VGIFPKPRTWQRELFRAIGKPGVDVVCRPRGKIHQHLHESELRIHLVPEAAAGQAGQDRCGQSAARVTYKGRIFSVQHHGSGR
jgi:hypothetical protein